MDELDRDGALAHARRAPLDRAPSYVPGHENARDTHLQKERLPLLSPADGTTTSLCQVWPGEQETVLVPLHDSLQPVRVRHGADEDEEGGRRHCLLITALGAQECDRLQPLVADRLPYGGAG